MATARFLPAPLFFLTILSLLFSVIIFFLSLQNYGVLSTWIGAGCSIATILYHSLICFSSVRKVYRTPVRMDAQQIERMSYTTVRLVWAYILLAMWITVLGLFVQVTIGGPGSLMASEINSPYNTAIQRAECAIIGLQTVTIGSLAVFSTISMRRLGADNSRQEWADEELFDGVHEPKDMRHNHTVLPSLVKEAKFPDYVEMRIPSNSPQSKKQVKFPDHLEVSVPPPAVTAKSAAFPDHMNISIPPGSSSVQSKPFLFPDPLNVPIPPPPAVQSKDAVFPDYLDTALSPNSASPRRRG